MKKLFMLILLPLFLLSCSSGPERVAKKFNENLAQGKVDQAKKYATESTGKLLDMASGFGGLPVDPNYQFKMVKDSVVKKNAWVTYIDPEGKEDTMKLVKIDGDWLVHMESDK